MNPFDAHNIAFFIALFAGLVVMLINAIGGVDHGSDHDIDHDVDHDIDGDHDHDGDHESDALFGRALSALGVGRVPLMLVLLVFFLSFGVVGIALNLVFGKVFPPVVYAWVTHAGALMLALLLTRFFATRVSRFMPKTESYNVSKEDLVRCLGQTVYSVSEKSGAVQVRCKTGDVYKIAARTSGGELIGMGADIVVVSYCDDGDYYIVTKTK